MPHFYSLNTYGFHNPCNQPNQSNTMSHDIIAGNASKTTDAISDSIITSARKNGMHLSNRCKLSIRQLKAFNLMRVSTLLNCVTKEHAIACWNSMPSTVREHPTLIALAVKSASYYAERRVCNITSENVTNKVQACLSADAIVIASKDGKHKSTLFKWFAKHSSYIFHNYRYDCNAFCDWLDNGHTFNGDTRVMHAWDVSKVKQAIYDNWEQYRHIPTYFNRIRNNRAERRIERTNTPVAMRDRLQDTINSIASVRPMHWCNSLTPMQQRIASRLRPDGACVGIELEFIASRGSDIVDWDDDDYPRNTWHSFKHDGSIGTANDTEACARFQEYTCFINADSDGDWLKVRNTLKDMVESGALINGTCGNHVHIDMRHKSQATYYRIAGRLRDAFINWAHRMVSHRRSNNRYCGVHNDHHNNRYTAINTACWNEHRTLEVRIGMPTLNYHKLYQWTQFLRYLCNNPNRISTLDDFMNGDAPLSMKLYVVKRILKFQNSYTTAGKPALEGFDKYANQINDLGCLDHDYYSQGTSEA